MRDRMEKIVILPFTLGCISESSVAVSLQHYPKRSKVDPKLFASGTKEEEEEEESFPDLRRNLPKSVSSPGFLKLFKGLKNISQLLIYKELEMEALEIEMDIGLPTDVKHLTHIGVDGSATTPDMNYSKAWQNLMNSG